MGIVNTNFSDKGSPLEKLTKTLDTLNDSQVDASFKDSKGNIKVDRTYLEMIISDYSQAQQNPQLFNKWIQIDNKLDKALREYKSDIQMLIAGVTQLGQAQAMIQEPSMDQPQQQEQPQAPVAPQNNATQNQLPTPRV